MSGRVCEICGRAVPPKEPVWFCNRAIADYPNIYEVYGHRRCVEWLDNTVVIPNRLYLAFARDNGRANMEDAVRVVAEVNAKEVN